VSGFDTERVRGFLGATASYEHGQDIVEYGLIIATIALVVLLGTLAFGNQIGPWFEHLAGRITTTGT
jgi:Flp pilus assembly pilin Flp